MAKRSRRSRKSVKNPRPDACPTCGQKMGAMLATTYPQIEQRVYRCNRCATLLSLQPVPAGRAEVIITAEIHDMARSLIYEIRGYKAIPTETKRRARRLEACVFPPDQREF